MRKRPIRKRESDWDVGDMNETILIDQYTPIPNGQGGTSDSWTPYNPDFDIWASVRSTSNNWKIDQNMKTTSDLKYFILWYDPNINNKMRIKWHNKSYRILGSIDYDSGYNYIKLQCDGNKTDAI